LVLQRAFLAAGREPSCRNASLGEITRNCYCAALREQRVVSCAGLASGRAFDLRTAVRIVIEKADQLVEPRAATVTQPGRVTGELRIIEREQQATIDDLGLQRIDVL